MEKRNILITGGDSFLAKSISEYFPSDFNVNYASRAEIDCRDLDSLRKGLCRRIAYDTVIHTAVMGGRRHDEDNSDIFYNNVVSSENIISCHQDGFFKKLIVFGSGSESINGASKKAYQLSKYIQTNRVRGVSGISNLRIFGLFSKFRNNDFITACISGCINNAKIEIWEDKCFDFIYAQDLASIILNQIVDPINNYKEIDCVYEKKYMLSEIAEIIKTISHSNSCIQINGISGQPYTGYKNWVLGNEVGLKEGIKRIIYANYSNNAL